MIFFDFNPVLLFGHDLFISCWKEQANEPRTDHLFAPVLFDLYPEIQNPESGIWNTG
jgi:hypothetical protein